LSQNSGAVLNQWPRRKAVSPVIGRLPAMIWLMRFSFARANHCVAPLFEKSSCQFGLKGLAVYRLDTLRLLVGQFAEFLPAGAL
jgi:hypothetical protein